MTGISVTSADDKPTREDQILALAALVAVDGVVRLRVPVQMYDEESRQYTTLRDVQWAIGIPKAQMTIEGVEDMLKALGVCIKAIGERGPQEVITRLTSVMS